MADDDGTALELALELHAGPDDVDELPDEVRALVTGLPVVSSAKTTISSAGLPWRGSRRRPTMSEQLGFGRDG